MHGKVLPTAGVLARNVVTRSSFSGLLNDVPVDVRNVVEPPFFFSKYPQLQPSVVPLDIPCEPGEPLPVRPIGPFAAADSSSSSSSSFLRCVMISDTHNGHRRIPPETLPPADVLIHAGDFTGVGLPKEIEDFCDWLDTLTQYRYKVVIPGNHDLSLDKESYWRLWERFCHPHECNSKALIERMKKSCIFLVHDFVEIEGVRFFGSAFQPEFCGWAFNLSRENFECYDKWASIPSLCGVASDSEHPLAEGCIDVLITHGPPLGVLDTCQGNRRQGCLDLLDFVLAVKPLVHVFGHIHEEFGAMQHTTHGTVFVNASMMNVRYQMMSRDAGRAGRRAPLVVDVPRRSARVDLPQSETPK